MTRSAISFALASILVMGAVITADAKDCDVVDSKDSLPVGSTVRFRWPGNEESSALSASDVVFEFATKGSDSWTSMTNTMTESKYIGGYWVSPEWGSTHTNYIHRVAVAGVVEHVWEDGVASTPTACDPNFNPTPGQTTNPSPGPTTNAAMPTVEANFFKARLVTSSKDRWNPGDVQNYEFYKHPPVGDAVKGDTYSEIMINACAAVNMGPICNSGSICQCHGGRPCADKDAVPITGTSQGLYSKKSRDKSWEGAWPAGWASVKSNFDGLCFYNPTTYDNEAKAMCDMKEGDNSAWYTKAQNDPGFMCGRKVEPPTTPGPTTNPSPGPTSSPTLGPVSVAAAAFDEVVDYFAKVGLDHCYTSTSAAKLDIKKLKSKFESYRMEILNVDRTDMMGGAKKALKVDFKKRQKTFAATKRDLRAKKRAAKLGGKSCVWTRSPTPPPTYTPKTKV